MDSGIYGIGDLGIQGFRNKGILKQYKGIYEIPGNVEGFKGIQMYLLGNKGIKRVFRDYKGLIRKVKGLDFKGFYDIFRGIKRFYEIFMYFKRFLGILKGFN